MKRILSSSFFLVFISLFTCAGLFAEGQKVRATVNMIDNIAVMPPHITLGEIAEIQTNDEELKEKLSELIIEKVPSLGLAKSVTSFKVKKALKDNNFFHIKVLGIQTSVLTLSKKMSQQDIKEWVKEWVEDQMPSQVEAEVNFAKLPREWKVPLGAEVELKIDARGRELGGKLRLRLISEVEGRVLSQTTIKVAISKFSDAYVVTRPLARGDEIKASNVEKRRVDITHLNGMEIQYFDDLKNMLTSRSIGVGEVVKVQDLEQPILVQSGSLNQIIVENGSIKMRIVGAKALQSGKKGDYILFSNPLNKKENLQAEVIKRGVAVMKIR